MGVAAGVDTADVALVAEEEAVMAAETVMVETAVVIVLEEVEEEEEDLVEAVVAAVEVVVATIAIKRDTLPVNAQRLANNKFRTHFMLFIYCLLMKWQIPKFPKSGIKIRYE